MARIELRAVSHRFDVEWILREVDLTLTEARIGVIGANGSGKSTLARMLNGLVIPSEGTVLVAGLDTARSGRQVRQQVGFIFTDPDAQIVMPTVAEDVAFSLRRRRLPRERVAELVEQALTRVGLAGLGDHPAYLLSGGQKQLLAIASVLATDPTVLVCDEPTTLLDARNSRRVAALLSELDQQVVMVTHDLNAVRDFDRVIVMDGGRVVADDCPEVALAWYRRLIR